MEIILKRKNVRGIENKIITPHNDPDKTIQPTLEGEFIADLIEDLNNSSGYYGHIINIDQTTNLDLLTACQTLPNYTFVSSSPEKITPSRLPDGADS